MIKKFSGLIPNLGLERIYLAGVESGKGFKVKDLQIISSQPGAIDYEYIVQVYMTKRTSTGLYDNIDFTKDDLLAVAYLSGDTSETHSDFQTVIFDETVFNQDIYISTADISGSTLPVNYMLTLEEVKMSDNESAVVNFNSALVHT